MKLTQLAEIVLHIDKSMLADEKILSALIACHDTNGLHQNGIDYVIFQPYSMMNMKGKNQSLAKSETIRLLSQVVSKKEIDPADSLYIVAKNTGGTINFEVVKMDEKGVAFYCPIDLSKQNGRRFFEKLDSFSAQVRALDTLNPSFLGPSEIHRLVQHDPSKFNLHSITSKTPSNLVKPPFLIRVFRMLFSKTKKDKGLSNTAHFSPSFDSVFSAPASGVKESRQGNHYNTMFINLFPGDKDAQSVYANGDEINKLSKTLENIDKLFKDQWPHNQSSIILARNTLSIEGLRKASASDEAVRELFEKIKTQVHHSYPPVDSTSIAHIQKYRK